MDDDGKRYTKVGLGIVEVDGIWYPKLPDDIALGKYVLLDDGLYRLDDEEPSNT